MWNTFPAQQQKTQCLDVVGLVEFPHKVAIATYRYYSTQLKYIVVNLLKNLHIYMSCIGRILQQEYKLKKFIETVSLTFCNFLLNLVKFA